MRAQPAGDARSVSVASSSLATAASVSPMARSARTKSSRRPAFCAASKAAWVSSSKTNLSRPCPDRRCRAALTFHRAGQSSTHTAPKPPLVAASSRIVRRT